MPKGAQEVVQARNLDPQVLHRQLSKACAAWPKSLAVFDTLHPILSSTAIPDPSAWLSGLITPTVHLLAVYHSSIPLRRSPSLQTAYQPRPLVLLQYLATSILNVHSLSHVIARRAARDRSRAPPLFGIQEAEEGVVQGLGANDPRGVVVECEMRRRSGRTVCIWFVLQDTAVLAGKRESFPGLELLDDHPLYRRPATNVIAGRSEHDESEHGEVSFSLSLTDGQRRERDGVVLPYFDAQGPGGAGEGGRILYDIGSEDDFDDEEDEI